MKLSPISGGTWKEKVLYNFGEYNGSPDQPEGALTIDGKGNLYGATGAGGTDQNGVVFELSPGSGGAWSFNVLWNFQSGTTFEFGASGKLIFDANGNLYGTTTNGGTEAVCGCGTVSELSPATGETWTEKIIYAFGGANSRDGATPNSDLTFDTHGNLYGTTFHGGVYDSGNGGTAFELSPTSGGWSETVLWSFGNTGDGFNPGGGLIIDSQGNLYGSTSTGPASLSDGNVFELSPTGGGSWSEKILHTFGSTSSDGIEPFESLLADAAGNLYADAPLPSTINCSSSCKSWRDHGFGNLSVYRENVERSTPARVFHRRQAILLRKRDPPGVRKPDKQFLRCYSVWRKATPTPTNEPHMAGFGHTRCTSDCCG